MNEQVVKPVQEKPKSNFFHELDSETDAWKAFVYVQKVLVEHRLALLFLYVERPMIWRTLLVKHKDKFKTPQIDWVLQNLPEPLNHTKKNVDFYLDYQLILDTFLEKEREEKGYLSIDVLKDKIRPGMPIYGLKTIFEHMLDIRLRA